jgi:hypothetical protein
MPDRHGNQMIKSFLQRLVLAFQCWWIVLRGGSLAVGLRVNVPQGWTAIEITSGSVAANDFYVDHCAMRDNDGNASPFIGRVEGGEDNAVMLVSGRCLITDCLFIGAASK